MELLGFQKTVERWGTLEISCKGPKDGNPFTGCHIRGTFTGKNETVSADGFYDGNGVYKVRFMPSFEGEYKFYCIPISEYSGLFRFSSYSDFITKIFVSQPILSEKSE